VIQDSTDIVLASASKARSKLLLGAGLSFTINPADLDEKTIKTKFRTEKRTACETAVALAEAKALHVSKNKPESLVIGADQMLDCEGVWYDKSGSPEVLLEHLKSLRGKTHHLVVGVAVAKGGEILWRYEDSTKLVMRDFSDEFLEDYVGSVGYLVEGSVGGYHLEGLGVHLFEEINGDYFSILGLPLLPLLRFLRSQGIVEK